jgi:CheY-like chemotaxis protein
MLGRAGCTSRLIADGADLLAECTAAAAAAAEAAGGSGGGGGGVLPPALAGVGLILLDIHMPRSNGVAVARQLRAMGYAGRLVAMTANASPPDVAVYMATGFDSVLAKPFVEAQLVAVVQEASALAVAVAVAVPPAASGAAGEAGGETAAV